LRQRQPQDAVNVGGLARSRKGADGATCPSLAAQDFNLTFRVECHLTEELRICVLPILLSCENIPHLLDLILVLRVLNSWEGCSMERLKIIYVDDNVNSNRLNCVVLREIGYDVAAAGCAIAAVEAMSAAPPAVLITDIELGPGDNGFDLARAARLQWPRLPVLYISSTARARFAVEGVPGSRFVEKPFHPHALIEALNHLLDVDQTPATPVDRRLCA